MSADSLRTALIRSSTQAQNLSGRSAQPVSKSTADFAELAVGPVYRHTVAEWILDRNSFVRAYKNSVKVGAGAIANKMAMQEVKILRRLFKKSGVSVEPVSPTHPCCELFRDVNPRYTEWDLWYYTEAWKILTGDSYWWKGRNLFGIPKEIWFVPSQWVRAIPSRTAFIGAYEIRNLFRTEHPVILPGTEVVQISEPNVDWNANGRFYGAPAILGAANSIDLEENMFNRLRSRLFNYAEPGQVFSTDKPLTEPQLRQIYNQIVNQHTATEHTGRPMITHSGLKPQNQKNFVTELDFMKSLDFTLTMTLAVLGVPKAVVGLVADANRSNTESAILVFCQNCINPRLKHNAKTLTKTIVREFEPDGSLMAYFEPCTPDDTETLIKAVETAGKNAALDPNEIREMLFKKPRFAHGGNRPFVPSAAIMADWGNDDPMNPEPGFTPAAPVAGAGNNGARMFGQQAPIQTAQQFQQTNGDGNDSGNGDDPLDRGALFRRNLNRTGPSSSNFMPTKRKLFQKSHESIADLIRDWERAHTKRQGPFSKAVFGALQAQKVEAISRYRTFAGLKKSMVTVESNGHSNGHAGMFGKAKISKAVGPDSAWNMVPVGRSELLLAQAADEQLMEAAMQGAHLELQHARRIAKAEGEVEVPSSARMIQGFMEIPGGIVGRIRQTLSSIFDRDYWKIVTDNTRQMLAKILLRSIQDGWSGNETVHYLESDPEHLFDLVRAQRIVRTETTAAINGGQWAAQEDLIAREITEGRQWLSILDNVTRNSHRVANEQQIVRRGGHWVVMQDGEQIGTGKLFIVGNERARFACDPDLSAAERVNCRCITTSLIESAVMA
jgi:phage portal protein BeeE